MEYPPGGRRGTIYLNAALVSVAVFALLVARNIPPEFPNVDSLQVSSQERFKQSVAVKAAI